MHYQFTLAALAAVAAAAPTNTYSYSNYSGSHSHSPTSYSSHSHHDPWEQCKQEIEELETELGTVSDKCDANSVAISSLDGTTVTLKNWIESFGSTATQNAAGVSAAQATNDAQDIKITMVKDDVSTLQTNQGALTTDVALLQQMVEMLKTQIADLTTRTDTIENTTIAAIQNDITQLNDEVSSVSQSFTTLNTQVATNTGEITTINNAITALQEDPYRIQEDFYSANNAAIDVAAGDQNVLSFCIDADKTVEIMVTGRFNKSIDNGRVSSVRIVQDSGVVPVAIQQFSDDTTTASESFSLFYRGTSAAGSPSSFDISLVGEAGTSSGLASISDFELQLGYRVYGTGYSFAAAATTSCT